MNSALFVSLLTIASAPAIDAPKGRQTLGAHNAPVPVVRRRAAVVTPTPAAGRCGNPVNGTEDCPCDDDLCTESHDVASITPWARVWSQEEITASETDLRAIAIKALNV
jgi:hypothetical protein